MNKKVESYKVTDAYREVFKTCMDYENSRRENLNEKPISKSGFIEYVMNYFFDHEVNEKNRKRKEDSEAQYYASITKKLVEKYFNTMRNEIEFLTGIIYSTDLHLKILMDRQDTFDEIDSRNMNKIVASIRSDEITFNRLQALYDAEEKKENPPAEKLEIRDDKEERRKLY